MRTRRELLLATLTVPDHIHPAAPEAQDLARRLAERYPANAPLGYVSARMCSTQRRLGGALAQLPLQGPDGL